jgi:hypothetical protein
METITRALSASNRAALAPNDSIQPRAFNCACRLPAPSWPSRLATYAPGF